MCWDAPCCLFCNAFELLCHHRVFGFCFFFLVKQADNSRMPTIVSSNVFSAMPITLTSLRLSLLVSSHSIYATNKELSPSIPVALCFHVSRHLNAVSLSLLLHCQLPKQFYTNCVWPLCPLQVQTPLVSLFLSHSSSFGTSRIKFHAVYI